MRGAALAASLAIIVGASPAYAHSEIKGIGSFYTGLLHPFLVPAHVLTIASVGLLLGQSGRAKVRTPLAVFLAVYAGALAATLWGASAGGAIAILLIVAAVAGILVALGPSPFSAPLVMPVAAAAGVVVGLDSGVTGSLPSTLSILVGTFIGGAYAVVSLAVFTSEPSRDWQRIGVRVVGSWAAASSFLVLALELSRYSL